MRYEGYRRAEDRACPLPGRVPYPNRLNSSRAGRLPPLRRHARWRDRSEAAPVSGNSRVPQSTDSHQLVLLVAGGDTPVHPQNGEPPLREGLSAVGIVARWSVVATGTVAAADALVLLVTQLAGARTTSQWRVLAAGPRGSTRADGGVVEPALESDGSDRGGALGGVARASLLR